MKPRIYLDHNASTPLSHEVARVVREFTSPDATAYGNPSSPHWAGVPAREAVDRARRQVAELLRCAPDEIVFTSGGSEANNAAIKGAYFAALARTGRPGHVITTAVEHPATLEPCRFLERLGARITLVPVDRFGLVEPAAIERAITPDTVLVSVMHANNEVGTIEPVEEIARLARARGVLVHTDAAQSVAKIPTHVDALGVDLLSIAGHKLGAPKGVGALYVRRGVALEPLVHGASHESGRRAGTESALLTAALGEACAHADHAVEAMEAHVRPLRDQLWEGLRDVAGDHVALNGHPTLRLPNTLNIMFRGVPGADVLAALDGVAASTGSACHSGSVTLSPVLRAMGVLPEWGQGAVRFSLGLTTRREEIEDVIARFGAAWPRLRGGSR
ncbi:cysteine desulfurase [Myxococcota bacterium]|nr:cysteine desulfurase [Myxococcota bacterium]